MNEYIKFLDEKSETPQHELVLKMLEFYGVVGVAELTDDQIKNYVERITINDYI